MKKTSKLSKRIHSISTKSKPTPKTVRFTGTVSVMQDGLSAVHPEVLAHGVTKHALELALDRVAVLEGFIAETVKRGQIDFSVAALILKGP